MVPFTSSSSTISTGISCQDKSRIGMTSLPFRRMKSSWSGAGWLGDLRRAPAHQWGLSQCHSWISLPSGRSPARSPGQWHWGQVERVASAPERALRVLSPRDRVAIMLFTTRARVQLKFSGSRRNRGPGTDEAARAFGGEGFPSGQRTLSRLRSHSTAVLAAFLSSRRG